MTPAVTWNGETVEADMPPPKPRCEGCRYWERDTGQADPDGSWGWCRRFPQTARHHADSWCGEHPDADGWLDRVKA